MRCKYKFRIHGKLKLQTAVPIPCDEVSYEFERNEHGVAEYIIATVSVLNRLEWPTVTENPEPGIRLGINIPNPLLRPIQSNLKVVEGLLSLYGLAGIDIENPEKSWHPDTEEERQALNIYSFASSKALQEDSEIRATPFDLVARSIIAAKDATNIEIPLSFYRKGRVDVRDRRYIEAFYDYYFVLETVYGGGKSKNHAVADEMKSSSSLISIIRRVFSDEFFSAAMDHDLALKKNFQEHYVSKTPQEVIDRLISIRGILHHHSSKNPNKWHPDDHARFEIDTFVIEKIAYEVVFALSEPFIFSDKTMQSYRRILDKFNSRMGMDFKWF